MRRSALNLCTLLVPALALACGDNTPAVDDEEGTGVTMASQSGTADSDSTAGDGDGDPAGDGDGDPCPVVCGGECCNADEVCDLDTNSCVIDCGGDPVCGSDPGQCCTADQVCFAGGCIVPGDPCQPSSCATDTRSVCGTGEVCDPDLGACVPDLADDTCVFQPEPGVFDPVPRFTWGARKNRPCVDAATDCQTEEICEMGTCAVTWSHLDPAPDDLPAAVQSVATPVVGDLDGDCIPEIVFNSFAPPNYTENGVLRVIRGDTGAKVWTIDDPAWQTDSAASAAIGDLDYDGVPEIVTPGEGLNLLAFAADGTPLWKSDNYTGGGKSGGVSIANFDGQGNAEIAYGRAVFDSNGALLWQGSNSHGNNGSVGKLSCVADINDDFRPDLIAGGTAYAFTGTVGVDFVGSVMWNNTDHGADGYCGLGDLDLDGIPEVVVVRSGWIDVLDAIDGTTVASIQIPGGGAGGPPNIADFDGDGLPDVGLAGGDFYVVVQYDGLNTLTELWRADTKDGSSSRTGSSVFDFDGDGRSEVVYFDEWYLRIYPGVEPDCALMVPGPACDGIMTDDEILFIDINSSQTRSEYPVVADVDGDFKAEIVVATNNWSGQGNIGDAGIEVFEDRLDNWVATLPIWNQHTYHVTNVDAKGGIPVIEASNWLSPMGNPENSYRRNSQGGVENCAPDLVPQDVQAVGPCQPDLTLSVRVCNQGCLGVGPGVAVSFFDEDAGLLGVEYTDGAIIAGTCEKVQLTVAAPHDNPFTVTVTVDDDGMGGGALNECIEDNNATLPVDVCPNIG
ncbi:FG-GAP repeat domain-containing protein [Enhygromyxa salina]|uniref:FG-GAP repeat protein n=1 Tax=Enhygromyxa salina TaxID=215803 RepID=A0A2S9YSW2_9BACT|nr:VCBS repeat-containing protein [Enhygromyxa salina]PRQ08201.1 FG-GAP repeat protein [Enhygromyxa salina]